MDKKVIKWRLEMPGALTVLAVLLFTVAILEAIDFPPVGRLWPMVVASVGLVLALDKLVLDLRGRGKILSREGILDLAPDMTTPLPIIYKRAARVAIWLIGLYLAGLWLFGFKLVVTLFLFLFFKIEAKSGWLMSIGMTAVWAFFFVFVVDKFLPLLWPQGWLIRVFGLQLPWLY